MAEFYTADLHLGHVNIIRYESRPFADVDAMNQGIIDRWNAQVGPDDKVYIIGDLVMGHVRETLELVRELNGHKGLLCGNHDRPWRGHGDKADGWADEYLAAGLDDVVDGGTLWAPWLGPDGADLCHFPYEEIERHGDRFSEWAATDYGHPLIHGHVHSAWRMRGRQINVGLDPWGGRLVTREELDDLLDTPDPGADMEAIPWS